MKTLREFITEATNARLTKDTASMQETRVEYPTGETYAISIQEVASGGLYHIWAQSRYREDPVPDGLFDDIIEAVVKHNQRYDASGYMMEHEFKGKPTKNIAEQLKRKLRFRVLHKSAEVWTLWKDSV